MTNLDIYGREKFVKYDLEGCFLFLDHCYIILFTRKSGQEHWDKVNDTGIHGTF